MPDLDGLKDKATDFVKDDPEKVKDGVEKIADAIDDKTGGKYSDHIDDAVDKLGDLVDGLGKDD